MEEKELIRRSFLGYPSLREDFWDMRVESQTGLSISEDKDHIHVEAQLPGLKSEEIEISFEKGMLWIRGEKEEKEEDKKRKYYRRASSSFSYQVRVPGAIDEKKDPEAIYKDGVLKVSFFKTAKPESKKIAIKMK